MSDGMPDNGDQPAEALTAPPALPAIHITVGFVIAPQGIAMAPEVTGDRDRVKLTGEAVRISWRVLCDGMRRSAVDELDKALTARKLRLD